MIHAVIFNLEGVLVTTDHCHEQAWREMAIENGIPFDKNTFERMRGLSRQDALEVLLSRARRRYTDAEKMVLSMRKADLYMDFISNLDTSCALPGAIESVLALRHSGIRTAVASSSQHARFILKHLGIQNLFDAVVDGNLIDKPAPNPEVFLLAAEKMNALIFDSVFECIVDHMTDEPLPEEGSFELPEKGLPVVPGETSSVFAGKINGRWFECMDNPMQIRRFRLNFDGMGKGVFSYINPQGEKRLPFGMGENEMAFFPQLTPVL